MYKILIDQDIRKLDIYLSINTQLTFDFYDKTWYFKKACQIGHLGLINKMMSKGFNFWNHGFNGACKGGHLKIANLMEKKCIEDSDINYDAFELFEQGFNSACKGGKIYVAKVMLRKIQHHKNFIFWKTVIWNACKGGNIDLLKFVISESGDNQCLHKNQNWSIAFGYACKGGNIDILKLVMSKLLMSKLDINNWGKGFVNACKKGHVEIVKLLLSKNTISQDDWSVGVSEACLNGKFDIIYFMLNKIEEYSCNKIKWVNLYESLYNYVMNNEDYSDIYQSIFELFIKKIIESGEQLKQICIFVSPEIQFKMYWILEEQERYKIIKDKHTFYAVNCYIENTFTILGLILEKNAIIDLFYKIENFICTKNESENDDLSVPELINPFD